MTLKLACRKGIRQKLSLNILKISPTDTKHPSSFEFSYRPEHSTVAALNKVCDDIRNGINNQDITVLVL